jgi:hypothetical protein
MSRDPRYQAAIDAFIARHDREPSIKELAAIRTRIIREQDAARVALAAKAAPPS